MRTTLLAGALAAACAGPGRFALRPPVTREEDRLVLRRPHDNATGGAEYLVENAVFRPLSRVTALARSGDARNVNALDEVPDSSWFTNRTPSVAESADGACAGEPELALPVTVRAAKSAGRTPGFEVRDARGRRYMIKFDQLPDEQPELSTGADAVVSRLYWSIGYHTPCNRVAYLRPEDVVVAPDAHRTDELGHRHPLAARDVEQVFRRLALWDGAARVSTSLFVEGEPLGPAISEGTRDDDPNDVIPHEDRRELRGERLLAAWINHWDARGPNSLDTFVHAPDGRGGYVRHYQLDFADALGAMPLDALHSPREGHTGILNLGDIVQDVFTLGLVRHSWDDDRRDPRAPILQTTFDVAHFHPDQWVPSVPSPRFSNADDQDVAWMARRIARITPEHLRAMLRSARFRNAALEARELELLVARRAHALRWSFERVSPLGELRTVGGSRVCATDLALTSGVSRADEVSYTLELRGGRDLRVTERTPWLHPEDGGEAGRTCVELPHFAPDGGPADDAAERYAALDIHRREGAHHTRLRAYFYDLGPARGFALVGIERP